MIRREERVRRTKDNVREKEVFLRLPYPLVSDDCMSTFVEVHGVDEFVNSLLSFISVERKAKCCCEGKSLFHRQSPKHKVILEGDGEKRKKGKKKDRGVGRRRRRRGRRGGKCSATEERMNEVRREKGGEEDSLEERNQ
jgi:hypothetical protein